MLKFRDEFGTDENGNHIVPSFEVSRQQPHVLSRSVRDLEAVGHADEMTRATGRADQALTAVYARAIAAARNALGTDAEGRFSLAGVNLRFDFNGEDVLFDSDLRPRVYIPRIEPERPYPEFQFRDQGSADQVDRMINWTKTLQERFGQRLHVVPLAPGRTPTETRARVPSGNFLPLGEMQGTASDAAPGRARDVTQEVFRALGADHWGVLTLDDDTQVRVSVEVLFTSSGFPAALRPIQVTPLDPDDPGPIAAE